MKRVIISLITLASIFSCTTVEKTKVINFKKENIYIEAHPLYNNQIEGINLNGELNLVNKEINRYKIGDLNNEDNSKIILDFYPKLGLADGLFINKTNDKTLLFEFKIMGEAVTVNKDIVFLIMPKDNETNIVLKEKLIFDNTNFKIKKITDDNFNYYYLTPIFIDENTFDRKIKEENNQQVKPISFNKEILVTQYNFKEKNDGKGYNNYISVLEKERIYFRDITIPNANISIAVKGKGIIETKSDDKGVYAAFIPIKSGVINIHISNDNETILKTIRLGGYNE